MVDDLIICPFFKPKISVSDLAKICLSHRCNESTRVNALRKMTPFREIEAKVIERIMPKPSPIVFTKEENMKMKNDVTIELESEKKEFDYKSVARMFEDHVKIERIQNKVSKMVLEDVTMNVPVDEKQRGLITDSKAAAACSSHKVSNMSDEQMEIDNDGSKNASSLCEGDDDDNESNKENNINEIDYREIQKIEDEQDARKLHVAKKTFPLVVARISKRDVLEHINNSKMYNKRFVRHRKKTTRDYGNFVLTSHLDCGWCETENVLLVIRWNGKINNANETSKRCEKLKVMANMSLFGSSELIYHTSGNNKQIKTEFIEFDEEFFQKEIVEKLESFVLFARTLTHGKFKELLNK